MTSADQNRAIDGAVDRPQHLHEAPGSVGDHTRLSGAGVWAHVLQYACRGQSNRAGGTGALEWPQSWVRLVSRQRHWASLTLSDDRQSQSPMERGDGDTRGGRRRRPNDGLRRGGCGRRGAGGRRDGRQGARRLARAPGEHQARQTSQTWRYAPRHCFSVAPMSGPDKGSGPALGHRRMAQDRFAAQRFKAADLKPAIGWRLESSSDVTYANKVRTLCDEFSYPSAPRAGPSTGS